MSAVAVMVSCLAGFVIVVAGTTVEERWRPPADGASSRLRQKFGQRVYGSYA
ncbi:hypothetical protein [Amycolatopsis rhizosphaerae]|uniref:hypothetical protein n=1 Tax=Amycolatopsis rhizosphaerae TaxID=2053003 RepID=UPI0016437FA5|nr:hypothetical protein [Amycolatopsis rhizosphaerae]